MAVNTEVGICHDTDAFNVANGGIIPDPLGKKPAGRGVSLIVDGVPIANFSTITSSGGEPETIDVTTHDTPGRYREERSSFSTPLEASFDIIYDPTHPSHIWLGYLFQTGKVVPVVVQIWNGVLPHAAEILFSGQVTAFPMPSFPIDGPYTSSITIGGIKNIRFPGMDKTPDTKAIKYAFGGCPGVFLPLRDKGAPNTAIPSSTDLTAQKIRAFPSTEWGDTMRVKTSDDKDMTWNGSAWVPWTASTTPPTETNPITAKEDGTFTPATLTPPKTKAELDQLTTEHKLKADPTGNWAAGKGIMVGSKLYTWNGSGWFALKATTAKSDGTFLPAGSQAPTTLAELKLLKAQPETAWTAGQKVTVKGQDYHWAGSGDASTKQWQSGAAT